MTIITVNYNNSEKTINLLESLRKQTNKNFDVIIVDNNSDPEEKSKLKNYQTDQINIVLIENDKNLGFSGGCNVGIRRGLQNGSDWIILLNNDAWVETDFISSLVANLAGKEGIVAVPLIEDGRIVYSGKVEWLKPALSHTFHPHGTNEYVIGGGMAVHKKVFDTIGFLDENYFLYFEDADFSLRARQGGLTMTILDAPAAYHQVSATTSRLGSALLLRYHYRNALYFNFKNGPTYIKVLVPFWSFFILIKQSVKLLTNKNPEISKAIIKGVLDFHMNNMGKIKT